MDKIRKALDKLSAKERAAVRQLLLVVGKGEPTKLDLKKLQGRQDIYRIRKGKIRIIFRRTDKGEFYILAIERRSEKTYRF